MKALGNYEFEFLQGIMQTKAHDPVVAQRFKGPFYSWYDVQHDGGDDMEYGNALLDDDVTFSYPVPLKPSTISMHTSMASTGEKGVMLRC